jgi:hypothetical protein
MNMNSDIEKFVDACAIKVVSKENSLTLVAESDWKCHVYFSDNNKYQNHYLGVVQVEYVCSQLILGLLKERVEGDGVYKHGDLDVFWIMSLFVGHASLYGNISDSGFNLFCVEDGGHYLPTITLNSDCIKQWVIQLSELRKKYQQI